MKRLGGHRRRAAPPGGGGRGNRVRVLTFTWDPDDASAGWALFVRFVGIAAVAIAVLAHRRSAHETAPQTSPR